MAQLIIQRKGPRTRFEDIDRVMDSMFDNLPSFSRLGGLTTRNPAVDVVEEESRYLITAELPGLDETRVDIKVENGVLTLSSVDQKRVQGETSQPSDEPRDNDSKPSIEVPKRYLIRERRSTNFTRNFVLPKDVKFDSITATFSHGLLTLDLPKEEKALPRKIEIKTQ